MFEELGDVIDSDDLSPRGTTGVEAPPDGDDEPADRPDELSAARAPRTFPEPPAEGALRQAA